MRVCVCVCGDVQLGCSLNTNLCDVSDDRYDTESDRGVPTLIKRVVFPATSCVDKDEIY